jgi:hypothetical protein
VLKCYYGALILNDRNLPPKTIPKIRDSATYIHIIQSLEEKQQARDGTSQNKGLLYDDKTAKNQADLHIVLDSYLKTMYYGDAVTQA